MQHISPLKAIREKCLDCSNGSYKEVELCPIDYCPIYPFRFGKNPNMRRELTEDQLVELRNRAQANLVLNNRKAEV